MQHKQCTANKTGRAFLGLLFGLLLCLPAVATAERVYLDISASAGRKMMVAVPYFAGGSMSQQDTEQGRKMAELLGRALEFHGFIDVIDPARYGGGQNGDWPALGADYVVQANYQVAGDTMSLEMRVLEVTSNKQFSGRRYRGAVAQEEDMVLRFCDELIKDFTGELGLSRTKIAFVSDAGGRKEAYVADVLGRHVRQVTRHKHLVVSPRFSRDGRYLAYSSYHTGNQNLYVTELAQDKETKAISRRKGMNLAPAWSPDGKTMAVTLSEDGGIDLHLMDLDGKIIRRLTSNAGINVSPSWSPDGKSLAFTSDRSGKPQVYVMDVASGQTHRITMEGKENSDPNWSPKGDRIAYTSLINGTTQVFTIAPDGKGQPIQVTNGGGEFEGPCWAPDGKMLVVSRRQGAAQHLYTVSKDGRNLRPLFQLKGSQSYPQWSGYLN